MTARKNRIIAASTLVSTLCFVAIVIVALVKDASIRKIQQKADRLDQICSFAKLTLRNDVNLITKSDAASPLYAALVDRIYGTTAGDDAPLMDACMTRPFNVAAWRACKLSEDHECVVKILTDASESIP